MDTFMVLLVVGTSIYAAFIGYLLVKHPDTAFKLQDRMIQAQKDYEGKVAKAGKRTGGIIALLLRRFL